MLPMLFTNSHYGTKTCTNSGFAILKTTNEVGSVKTETELHPYRAFERMWRTLDHTTIGGSWGESFTLVDLVCSLFVMAWDCRRASRHPGGRAGTGWAQAKHWRTEVTSGSLRAPGRKWVQTDPVNSAAQRASAGLPADYDYPLPALHSPTWPALSSPLSALFSCVAMSDQQQRGWERETVRLHDHLRRWMALWPLYVRRFVQTKVIYIHMLMNEQAHECTTVPVPVNI